MFLSNMELLDLIIEFLIFLIKVAGTAVVLWLVDGRPGVKNLFCLALAHATFTDQRLRLAAILINLVVAMFFR